MTEQRKLIEGMTELFPNVYRIIKIKEMSRKTARDVRRYIMFTEKAHRMAAKSKLRFCWAMDKV